MNKRFVTSYRLGSVLEKELKKVVPSIYQTKAEFFRAAVIHTIVFEKEEITELMAFGNAFNVSNSVRLITMEYTPRMDRLFKGYYYRMRINHPELKKFPTKSDVFRMCCWNLLKKFHWYLARS